MRFLPPGRWFQFKLSTWFVLIAILAWAMLEWPWVVSVSAPPTAVQQARQWLLKHPGQMLRHPAGYAVAVASTDSARVNPRLLGPAIALGLFAAGKSLAAIGRSRHLL